MPDTSEARSFGAWLKRYRKSLDLTQKSFAQLAGYSEIAVRKMEAGVKVIAISGNPLSGDMLRLAEQLGAIAVLEKPFTTGELAKAVATAVEKKDVTP